jgi:hypothetical protein
MKKVIIWIIQGYEKETPDGRIDDVVSFEVYADNIKEAKARAKQLMRKKHYRVQRVIEKTE